MIKRDDLKPGTRFRIPDGAHLSLQDIQNMFLQKTDHYGISLSFRQDFICNSLVGNLLGIQKFECTVLSSHPKGKSVDFVMTMQTEGTYLFITLCEYRWGGNSKWRVIVEDIFKELFE